MKQVIIILLSCVLISCNCNEKNIEDGMSSNPFFGNFNEVIDFAAIAGENIDEATVLIQENIDAMLKEILDVDDAERTFENTMLALDNLYAKYGAVSSPIYLMSRTHPDSIVRSRANASNIILGKYGNDLSLNEDLYKALKNYSLSDEAKALTGYKAKFVKDEIESAERNGFALSKEDREKLKVINDELSLLGNSFNQNISNYKDFLIVAEADMDGTSEDFKAARKQEDGTYKVDLSYPSYRPFMKYSNSDSARKELSMKYTNRAYPDNIEVLDNLLAKRKEMAELLGHRSFAEYRLESRMAKTPETVWAFETKLKEDLTPKAKLDYEEVLTAKQSKVKGATTVKNWEGSYYNNILLEEKYQLDSELVKEYFSLDDVLNGLFTITQTIFDLEYKEVENPSVWQEDVKMYEVYQDGKIKGRFYLDLHPRENKYGHAACFGIKNGKMTPEGYRIPTASLVCNFPQATDDKPALMPHSQVKTFFHEFGHVLHQMVTTADLVSQSGTNVSRDFVEAPSQIFENWTWNYDALKMFAKHYKTGEVLPKDLFDKMLAAKNVGSGSGALRQVFLGTYDMTLHDTYDPASDITTTDVMKEITNDMFPWSSYRDGTHFQAAFGHLNGYGAGYYGYMWSKVYAQDMFSIFEENGILDKETGIRYRDIILGSGSSKDELELVKEFLGREPNNDAFLRELGL
jgi:thimet oligopeptidase